ncbi:MFS transporter [Nocardia yunnanensis]|uniref:MFS transporter n=1 Tax=Nocardia yunnanensis TaxID=2382165 RepID=UPI001CA39D74|nr:MFS transporter [Nocardia yunnanensis]
MPIAVFALALCAFAIGLTEFVVAGLLPNIAGDLQVSIPATGLLVSGYALGVVIGAPLLTALTGGVERRRLLTGLMGLFLAGSVVSALAPGYAVLMLGRLAAALAHGAFMGVGTVAASELVPRADRSAAGDLRVEITTLRQRTVLLALLTTVLGFGGVMTSYT